MDTVGVRPLLVGADDRTGALESAGAAAHAGVGAVPVVTIETVADASIASLAGNAVVIDLGSRHLAPAGAAARAVELDSWPAERQLHKIDSTLRGNWAHELVARFHSAGRAVLVVPALPALGRVCVGGMVLVDGRPVTEGPVGRDAVAPPASSRPAELLSDAGAPTIAHLSDGRELGRWLDDPLGLAVADASTGSEIDRIVDGWWSRPDILLAGTAAVVGAAAAHWSIGRTEAVPPCPRVRRGVIVVCGSLHPTALEQVRRAEARGATVVATGSPIDDLTPLDVDRPMIVVPPKSAAGRVDGMTAADVAARLAERASVLERTSGADVVVAIGGDTAAAVFGPGPVIVGGTLAPGTPWGHRHADGRLVIGRAGGFGGPDALVELLWGTLAP